MKKVLLLLVSLTLVISVLTGCSADKEGNTIVIAWYPNESGTELKAARDEIGSLIAKATGKNVEHKLTTDYNITIEAVATGNAHIAFTGAEGYIQANKKNAKILPLVVNAGKSGTLDDAIYYSWLSVKKGNEDQYKSGDDYVIDNIQGKRFSFVSNSSTSGFRVPSAGIINHFSSQDKWKNLMSDQLIEGGSDKFFSEVLFGGSHQGSAISLLTEKADVAAFCDTCVANYVEFSSGTENKPGAVYKVRDNADEPFNTVPGAEFVLISVTPVLNAPFICNTEVLSENSRKAIIDAMTSAETTNNQKIFVPKDAAFKGLWAKTGDERFLTVQDEWFNPIRELSK